MWFKCGDLGDTSMSHLFGVRLLGNFCFTNWILSLEVCYDTYSWTLGSLSWIYILKQHSSILIFIDCFILLKVYVPMRVPTSTYTVIFWSFGSSWRTLYIKSDLAIKYLYHFPYGELRGHISNKDLRRLEHTTCEITDFYVKVYIIYPITLAAFNPSGTTI